MGSNPVGGVITKLVIISNRLVIKDGGMGKEYGEVFSSEDIREIREGRKTQHRNLMKPQPDKLFDHGFYHENLNRWCFSSRRARELRTRRTCRWFSCPYGSVGDKIWCKEKYAIDGAGNVRYRTDFNGHEFKWKSASRMPRYACRLVLEITAVRIEKIQDISIEDLYCEGIFGLMQYAQFKNVWCSRYGKDVWDRNGWVWVRSFKKC